jgi:hypothetical protein
MPHQVGETQDSLGDQFGMLDDVARVGDHTRALHFVFRNLDALKQVILV